MWCDKIQIYQKLGKPVLKTCQDEQRQCGARYGVIDTKIFFAGRQGSQLLVLFIFLVFYIQCKNMRNTCFSRERKDGLLSLFLWSIRHVLHVRVYCSLQYKSRSKVICELKHKDSTRHRNGYRHIEGNIDKRLDGLPLKGQQHENFFGTETMG